MFSRIYFQIQQFLKMGKFLGASLKFVLAWALVVAIPHYQQQNSFLSSLISIVVACFAFVAIRNILEFKARSRNISWALLGILSLYLSAFFLFLQGSETFYLYWSKFGAGSMVLNGSIVPFGDLAQITSAIDCDTPLKVGVNICDPWGRVLNQNPEVIEVFRLLNLSNLPYTGMLSVVLFFCLILLFNYRHQVTNVSIPVFLITPVSILAIERGNELITLILILAGFHLLYQRTGLLRPFGALLLMLSALFKLWPTIIPGFLFFFTFRNFRVITKLLLLAPMIYWFINFNLAKVALHSTQKGSPSGSSFGARFFVDERIPRLLQGFYVLLFISLVIILITYFQRKDVSVDALCSSPTEAAIICSTFITYFCVWLVGQSFMYRLLILLPALLVLVRPQNWSNRGTRFLVSLILVTAFTAKLQISMVLTSALAFALLYLAVALFRRWFNSSSRIISRLINVVE